MMPALAPLRALRTPARLLALLCVLASAGCWGGPPGTRPVPGRLRAEVLRVLDTQTPSPAYYRERSRLEVLGRELDDILFWVVQDQSLAEHVRANAVSLLADRATPGSLVLLRRVLISSGDDAVRLAAVTGIQRFATDSPQARNALRAAVGDPSQRVRLNALQGLDVEDVGVLRSLLTREPDAQVRLIARQLLTLFEARGAPLQADAHGDLRTAAADSAPRIVFQAAQRDVPGGPQIGGLWVEMGARRLVPLAQGVEVVEGVVPAFFNGAGRMVVFEAEREIRVRDLATGQTRVVGPGVAPRAIPFSERFVFLQEVPSERRDTAGGTALTYRVMTVPFAGGVPVRLGLLRAMSRPDRLRGASPVRRMVVGELRQGFVLRGPGVTPFVLPAAPESAAPR
ncbi:MAG TPA: HEAT repeat domain-containing protein [Longimicrobium sp.]|nr:HEAT repeat domain-containing protein [Longimicrobium sp.]